MPTVETLTGRTIDNCGLLIAHSHTNGETCKVAKACRTAIQIRARRNTLTSAIIRLHFGRVSENVSKHYFISGLAQNNLGCNYLHRHHWPRHRQSLQSGLHCSMKIVRCKSELLSYSGSHRTPPRDSEYVALLNKGSLPLQP